MGFVSVSEMRKFTRNYSASRIPTVTLRRTGTAYITRAVYGDTKPPTIEVQLDTEEKIIRIRTGEGLAYKLIGRVGHTFSFPKRAAQETIPEGEKSVKIELTKMADGWWYGSYSNNPAKEEGK